MTTLDAMLRKAGPELRKPPHTVTLPLAAWADGPSKPAAPTTIGMFTPSEEAIQIARRDALEAVATYAADGDDFDRNAVFNDAIIREILSRSTSLAIDVTQPFFDAGALGIARRLTTDGVKRLWHELETLIEGSSPAMPEATDEGFSHLVAIWDRGIALDHMPTEEAKKIRRLVEYVRQSMAEAEERAERSGVLVA